MNRVTSLFGIRYPIIQGGMVWCSGWRLAAAVAMREGWACSAQVRCIPKRCGSISGNAVRLRIMLLV